MKKEMSKIQGKRRGINALSALGEHIVSGAVKIIDAVSHIKPR